MANREALFQKVISHFFAQETENIFEKIQTICEKKSIAFSEIPENSLLKKTFSPPPLLFFRGDFTLLSTKNFSIVGSRYPSQKSIAASLQFARKLARENFCIMSGLARGVDSYAHLGALQVKGKTIAVLGCGLDQIYPPENARLADKILESGGLLISEYPPLIPPLKHHFPRRNRIIAGNSEGLLVVEANLKSGSLITAQFAIDEGKDLFVIPGEWQDAKFLGSHQLIQQGANLVTHPSEILNFYGIKPQEKIPNPQLKNFFEKGVNELGGIWARSGLSISELSEVLAKAILEDQITEISPQHYVFNDQ